MQFTARIRYIWQVVTKAQRPCWMRNYTQEMLLTFEVKGAAIDASPNSTVSLGISWDSQVPKAYSAAQFPHALS